MNSLNKTFLPTQDYKNCNWYVIDCSGQTLGRLATVIAGLLKGKNKAQYHPSVDTGDYVVLINAEAIVVNETAKHYIVRNPGRPGRSLKIRNVVDCLPRFTIERAVKRMLSNTEGKRLMRRLKIYNGDTHVHQAQNPITIDVTNLYSSIKNTK
uniref:Large ribosomal subunit protein uL13c n=1 Tax=Pseudo-nitzschia multiseries TaxID=37319 RepID=A0A0K1DCL0_PSEMU|nr:ribosomal protein L13 [Pseudo-nitzschia multiseries]AKT26073.1 ribosomal protein L13 [Pseudo-nitzschia multiseries]UBA15574.1 ribosomal protein L13 [Pseudo-nitzschia multiseries]